MITTQLIWERSGDSALNKNPNQRNRGLKDDAGSTVGTTVTGRVKNIRYDSGVVK